MSKRACPGIWLRLLVLVVVLLNVFGAAQAATPTKPKSAIRKPKPKKGPDAAYVRKRTACNLQTDTAQECLIKEIDVENCIMKCISVACYSKVYSEPLEEGEVAFEKGNRFKRCAKEEIRQALKKGESL